MSSNPISRSSTPKKRSKKSRPQSSSSSTNNNAPSSHKSKPSSSGSDHYSQNGYPDYNQFDQQNNRSQAPSRNSKNGRPKPAASPAIKDSKLNYSSGYESNSDNHKANKQHKQQQNAVANPTEYSEEQFQAAKYYLNSHVLRLHDKQLGNILYTTTVCNIYVFDVETEGWNKSYCQGPLFLYSRITQIKDAENNNELFYKNEDGTINYGAFAPYSLMALNRLSLDNFSLAVTPKSIANRLGVETIEIYRDGDFLIVKSPDGIMYGIYLFKEEERKMLLEGIQWCLDVQM